MSHTWLRLYTEITRDPKVLGLSHEHFRFWVNCLCLAKDNKGSLPCDKVISRLLNVRIDRVTRFIQALETAGLIDNTDPSQPRKPHNWNGRQYEVSPSTQRVKKHRERYRNVSETLHETFQQPRETLHETPPDTDTDTDTEKPVVPIQVSNPSAGAGTGNDDWEKNYRERKREREHPQIMSEQQVRERLEFLQHQREELLRRANENGSR